jgi:FAS-associated factor 2
MAPPDLNAQQELIESFRQVTGDSLDEEHVREVLLLHDWNLERAVLTFFGGGEEASHHLARHDDGSDDLPEDDDEGYVPEAATPAAARFRAGNRNRSASPSSSSARARQAAAATRRGPGGVISSALRWMASAPLREPFHAQFAALVRNQVAMSPEFSPQTFVHALTDVTSSGGTLAVYLHSPLHPHSRQFCRQVLCDPAVINALSLHNNITLWGGCIEDVDGYLASEMLQVSGYPSLALVANESGRATVFERAVYQSSQTYAEFAEHVVASVAAFRARAQQAPHLAGAGGGAASAQDAARRRLIVEQDEALKRAIEEDRARQERKQAERLQAEQDAERQLREEASRAKQLEQDLETKRARVPVEPAAAKSGDVTTMRVQMPDGSRLQRRFHAQDLLRSVYDVIDLHMASKGVMQPHYVLESNFPKTQYQDKDATLAALGLVPQAVLFVQDLDS